MTDTSKRLEVIIAAIDSVNPQLTALSDLNRQVTLLRRQITKAVSDASVNLPALSDHQKDDPELVEEVEEALSELSYSLDMEWNGGYGSYDTWEPGERVEFWIPSTC